MRYVQTKDLGYDKENLIYIPFKGDLASQYQVFKQQLSGMPGTAAVTRSTQAPSHIGGHVYDMEWEGKRPDAPVVTIHNGVGYGFMNMLRLTLVEGRDFSRDFATDSSGYIVNETTLKMMGYEKGVGKWLSLFGRQGLCTGEDDAGWGQTGIGLVDIPCGGRTGRGDCVVDRGVSGYTGGVG